MFFVCKQRTHLHVDGVQGGSNIARREHRFMRTCTSTAGQDDFWFYFDKSIGELRDQVGHQKKILTMGRTFSKGICWWGESLCSQQRWVKWPPGVSFTVLQQNDAGTTQQLCAGRVIQCPGRTAIYFWTAEAAMTRWPQVEWAIKMY